MHIGGLQILHHNQWVDVPPVPGAIVINIGDLLHARLMGLVATKQALRVLQDHYPEFVAKQVEC
ncbi:putative deacetoxyvindoline 4-hydroxylase [Helianthus debilis subsp. tardiflorus]